MVTGTLSTLFPVAGPPEGDLSGVSPRLSMRHLLKPEGEGESQASLSQTKGTATVNCCLLISQELTVKVMGFHSAWLSMSSELVRAALW